VPIHKVKPEDKPKSSNGWKVASYISFLVIIALIVLNVITRFGQRKILEHSIAVLPFENDSQDQENDYLIAGYRTSIVDMLSKIEDLRVLPRVSTDQYRDNPRAPREIAEELDVSYLILANGQKYGNQIVLTVQLVDIKEKLIWSHSYEKQIQSPHDHIKIQSEIAQLVAKEVGAHVTPVEKQCIEKIPTTNNEAYNYYTRGREEVVINSGYYRMTDSRSKAKNLFHRSLELDSTFALAYAGLGWVYMYENESEIKYLGAHVDSALYYVQKALSYDDQLDDAYEIRGDYYRLAGNFDLSEADFKRAIDINPNRWFAYHTLANLYINYQDYILGLSNLHKAATLCTGEMLESILARTGGLYAQVGFGDIAKSYFTQGLNLNGDSLEYYRRLAFVEWNNGNIREQLEYEIKASKLNPSLARDLELGMCYFLVNDFRHALLHYEKYLEDMGDSTGELFDTYHRLAYAYTQTGSKDKAKYYFEKQTETCIEAEKTGSYYFVSGLASYDLA
jgi:TolB-like protein/Tfp pilus assembly protein PilF